VIYRAVPAAPPSIVPRLNLLVIFSDINSEFNLPNANLVTPVGYQLMLSIAAKEQHQRANGVSKRGNGSCCEKTTLLANAFAKRRQTHLKCRRFNEMARYGP
jgi:hypothetical protein